MSLDSQNPFGKMDELDGYYYPYETYANLIKMLAYRKLVITKSASYPGENHVAPLNQTEFTRLFQNNQYITIVAKDGEGRERRYPKGTDKHTRAYPTVTYIVQLAPESVHMSKSATLEKLMRLVGLNKPPQDRNIELLLVYKGEFGPNLRTKLSEFEWSGIIEEEQGGVITRKQSGYQIVQTVPYYMFTTEAPKHMTAVPHIPLKKSEERELMAVLRIDKSALPVIRNTDTMSIWYGLMPGMIVRQIVDSEITGQGVVYRLVKVGPVI